jgi:predicted metal-dependent peptidase
MHELLHVVFLHFARMEGRDHKKWNYATDYAINLLLNNKEVTSTLVLKMPKGGLLDPKYRNMSAEQIYDTNPTNPNKDKKTSTQEAPKVGDYIKSKDGRYGKITGENPDGTFSIDEVSKEEASKYAKI